MKRFYQGSLLLSLMFLFGCQSTEEPLENQFETVTEQYTYFTELPENYKTLDWDSAKERVLNQNLGLQRAYNGLLEAAEAKQRVFLDLLPSLSVSANISEQLTNLGNLNSEGLNYGIFSSINIPGIVRLRLNHYTALLQEIRATWAWELERREKILQLRSLFIRQANFDRRAEMLAFSGVDDDEVVALSLKDFGQRPAELERRERKLQLERNYDRLQLEISELLNDYSSRWVLDVESLPILYAGGSLPEVTELESFGVLWRQLKAIELEGARMNELGAFLSYWPDLSLSLNSPPLYRSNGGNEDSFDIDSVTATFRSSLQIDTKLRTAFRLRQIRRSNQLILDRLHGEVAQLVQRMQDAMEAYKLNVTERLVAQMQYDLLLETLADSRLSNSNNQLESLLQLEDQLARIDLEQAEFEALFWLLDEGQWQRLSFEALYEIAREREQRTSLIK